jgi:hypothetical protein
MQQWIDIANEFDESATGRIRLWIRRHSTVTVIVLAALVPVAYFAARSRI